MYLVLGGTGLIGRNLVARLVKKEKVRVLARNESNIFDGMNVEMVYADFKSMEFDDILQDVDVVFHLISSSTPFDGIDGLEEEILADVIPTIRLLDKMQEKNVKKLFYISSGGTVYGEMRNSASESTILHPECIYAANKVVAEQYIGLYNKYCNYDIYILRVSNPYGSDKKTKKQGIIPIFTNRILNEETIEIWGDGTNKRDYIHIDEVVDAIEAVESYTGAERIFNIGTGKSLTTIAVISILCTYLEKSVNVRFMPNRKCDIRNSLLDVSLIERECHWKSKISLEEGIKRYMNEIG